VRVTGLSSWKSIAALLGLGLALLPGQAGAICPSKKKGPGGAVPPGMRQPFDPPPEAPADEPVDPPPNDTVDPAPAGKGPTTPGGLPAPKAPTTPDLGGGPSGRERPQRGLDALDDDSWELWWALNKSDVLPRVKRQADSPDGAYARTLPAELRPAFDAILAAMQDSEPTVREAAVGALAGFVTDYRRADAIAELRRMAQGADHWHRDLCHLGLGLRGDVESAESMRKVLRSKHEEPVSRAFAALGLINLGTAEGMAEVEKAAEDLEEADVAGCVLIGLGQTKDPKHLPRLMEAAKRRGGSAVRLRRVRADAITALGKHGDPSSIEFLGSLLDDKEKVIARAAALALGGFKDSEPAAQLLRKQGLASEDPFVRGFAAISLGRIGNLSSVPALAGRVQVEEEVGVRPFLMLGAGLTRDAGALVLLDEALQESPRSGRFSAAAVSAGLLSAPDEGRARLRAALSDVRKPSAPACGALGLGLLADKASVPHLRKAFWFDSTRVRPSFDDALSMLGAEDQATWLVGEYKAARRSSARQAIAGALAKCGGPSEGPALVEFYKAAPHGDAAVRISLLTAMAIIINDRVVSQPRSLLLHTYYLQPNDVLGHIMFLP
jgi:HEAT repeat protein